MFVCDPAKRPKSNGKIPKSPDGLGKGPEDTEGRRVLLCWWVGWLWRQPTDFSQWPLKGKSFLIWSVLVRRAVHV